MMKKFLLLVLLGLFVTACTTKPERDQGPEVVDKSGGAEVVDGGAVATEAGGAAQTFGSEEALRAALQELNNPESLLSVRVIYFEYDSNEITSEAQDIVKAHAAFLQANPGMVTTLEGHADERGSREYNLALGERRALAVKQQLVVLGASSEQVRIVSYGEERPAAPGHDEQAWGLNRRAEFVY